MDFAAGDARYYPIYGYQFRFGLPIIDKNGSLVVTGTGSGTSASVRGSRTVRTDLAMRQVGTDAVAG